jgi:glutaredoxin
VSGVAKAAPPDGTGLELKSVVLYTASGCHLCEQARAVLDAEAVAYDEVDITGDPALEAAYREWLPVLEIDGERAFVYRIPPETLRRRLEK